MTNEEALNQLLKLIKENPTLPVFPFVEPDCCYDEYVRYLCEFGDSRVETILISDEFEKVFDDKEDFKETYYDFHDDEFEGLSEEEIEKKLDEICNEQEWQKVILVNVNA